MPKGSEMSLKLMYITNKPEIARIAERAGVDRVFVDLEYIGKESRQGGMNTVQSHHTINDIADIRKSITKAQLLVRCNPIHKASDKFTSSEEEIKAIIENGADIIMLPYFKSVKEVEDFIEYVGGRAKTVLLVETPEAVSLIDDILNIGGIDETYIGLNDLSIGYGKKFLFELLADGTVERLCYKFKEKGLPYGFGGIASLGHGALPSEMVIKEHYRLGSTRAILSRSFCDVDQVKDLETISSVFMNGIRDIREFEKQCEGDNGYFSDNQNAVKRVVKQIVESR